MTDLIDRLRNPLLEVSPIGARLNEEALMRDMKDAACEIERLSAEVSRLRLELGPN